MKMRYQFGYHLLFTVVWRTVSAEVFEQRVGPLLLKPEQFATIRASELLPFFQPDFILRDGWRLYRAVKM